MIDVKVGIPREVKNNEFRVAITPAGVHELVRHGHQVVIERDAGVGSSITNQEYVAAGGQILDTADEVWAAAGTWTDVFPIAPADLVRVSGGVVADLRK